tara:strand:- start:595 stop:780 length:186 start_codon:yes stop_codon:yes gene_type:complete
MSVRFKKHNVLTLLALVIMAISIAMFNLDVYRASNTKSYIGLIIAGIVLIFTYTLRRKKLL